MVYIRYGFGREKMRTGMKEAEITQPPYCVWNRDDLSDNIWNAKNSRLHCQYIVDNFREIS